jgi:hypothetical protein
MNSFSAFGFHRPRLLAGIAAAVLAAFSCAAAADAIRVSLSGDMEVPPVRTTASGNAIINVNPDMSVSGMVATTGVAGTMAHIHHGASGKNGPVLIALDKNGDNGWMVPAGAKLSDAQYRAYKAGELYISVHSAEHKGGEIRGQLSP